MVHQCFAIQMRRPVVVSILRSSVNTIAYGHTTNIATYKITRIGLAGAVGVIETIYSIGVPCTIVVSTTIYAVFCIGITPRIPNISTIAGSCIIVGVGFQSPVIQIRGILNIYLLCLCSGSSANNDNDREIIR